jgi:hypothetical protein
MRAFSLIAGFLATFCACGASAMQADADISVSVDGLVGKAGVMSYPAKTRLSSVALAARVDSQAYMLGAAWLRPSLLEQQTRLRAGVVFELGAIRVRALSSGNDVLARDAARLQAFLATLPVTGRRVATVLDPYRLEVTPEDDWTVADGDALHYPRRPEGVRVLGAVDEPCHLALQPMQDARRYLKLCHASKVADRNRIFVVQPDGAVYEQNIAAWNRDAPRTVAPGSWIYVPLDQRTIAGSADATFNREIADFLATQLVGDEGRK